MKNTNYATHRYAVFTSLFPRLRFKSDPKARFSYIVILYQPVRARDEILHCKIQGGSNMTGTDLCVNKPHCAAAVRPSESEATTPPSLLLGLEPVQSCLGVARVMSNYGYKKKKKSVPFIFEPSCICFFYIGILMIK